MAAIPAAVPYPAAGIHYVGSRLLADTAPCTAAIVTAVLGEDKHAVTATLFMPQGVPAPGAYAVYDPNPDAAERAAGTWHWPADDDTATVPPATAPAAARTAGQ